jgi:hypothetical protein
VRRCRIEGFEIGDTIADIDAPEALPPITIDEPTMSMLFTINNSPFFGKECKFVTSQKIRERLIKETEKNLAYLVRIGQANCLVYKGGDETLSPEQGSLLGSILKEEQIQINDHISSRKGEGILINTLRQTIIRINNKCSPPIQLKYVRNVSNQSDIVEDSPRFEVELEATVFIFEPIEL